ncbi:MAG: fatty acid--CoA ligase, partial [Desulfobacterales bacterium]|jgi:fatty-acyl-CoA synthase
VVLKKEFADKVKEEDLLNFFMKFVQNGTIPKFGVPSQVLQVESIAKTSVGKINKRALRKQFRL